ncbi:MAG: hypothetical protein PHN49_08415 [Candidatus Omnitrophica bacterium]|nr:hypothetical protein [Candidatus Omnitrophota bacterium]MDD5671647.1 hypothetical protein [Candidatus Omnitrophota bacterium]
MAFLKTIDGVFDGIAQREIRLNVTRSAVKIGTETRARYPGQHRSVVTRLGLRPEFCGCGYRTKTHAGKTPQGNFES